MADLFGATLDEMISEVHRELAMRSRLYAQWKQGAGIVKRNQLDRQYEVMEAILKHLESLRHAQSGDDRCGDGR